MSSRHASAQYLDVVKPQEIFRVVFINVFHDLAQHPSHIDFLFQSSLNYLSSVETECLNPLPKIIQSPLAAFEYIRLSTPVS